MFLFPEFSYIIWSKYVTLNVGKFLTE